MTDDKRAALVPLVEQLRSVPEHAVLRIDTPNALGCVDTRTIPIGRLCHEAADIMQYGNCDFWCPACYADVSDPKHRVGAIVAGRDGGVI